MNSYASHGQLPAIDPKIRNLRQQDRAPRAQHNRSTSLLQRTKHQSKILPHLWLQADNTVANHHQRTQSNGVRLEPLKQETNLRSRPTLFEKKLSQPLEKLSFQKAVYSFQISAGLPSKQSRKQQCEVLGNVMELTIFDGLQDDVLTNDSKNKTSQPKSKNENQEFDQSQQVEDLLVADIMGKLEQYNYEESSSNSSQDHSHECVQAVQNDSVLPSDSEEVESSFKGYRFGKVLPPSKNLSQLRKSLHLEDVDSSDGTSDQDDSMMVKGTSTPKGHIGRYSSPISGIAQATMTPTGADRAESVGINEGKSTGSQRITVMEAVFRKNLKKRVDLQRKSGFAPDSKIQEGVCKQIKGSKIKLGAKPKANDFHGNLDYQSQRKAHDRQQERLNVAAQLATKSKSIIQREYKLAIKQTIKEKYRNSILAKEQSQNDSFRTDK